MAYTDLMLDLETWGTTPQCAIRSIGARLFNLADAPPRTDAIYSPLLQAIATRDKLYVGTFSSPTAFYCNVDDASNAEMNRTFDPATVAWWEKQDESARAFLVGSQVGLPIALDALLEFIRLGGSEYGVRVWSHGATFDIAILEDLYRSLKRPVPWDYRDVRDTRTMLDLAAAQQGELVSWSYGNRTHAHFALADADFQVYQMQLCNQIINRGWWGRLGERLFRF